MIPERSGGSHLAWTFPILGEHRQLYKMLKNVVRSLNFGFFELDCLLIHGSTVGVSDELTPDTPPIHIPLLSHLSENNLKASPALGFLFCHFGSGRNVESPAASALQ